MRILITGASGMLGVDVQRAARAAGHEIVALARAQLDIRDAAAVAGAVADAAPDAVINCAAWTDVDGAEARADDAMAINGAGAGIVVGAAAAASAWAVHVSSDYVFDGHSATPYVESDPVNPLSAYGRSKLQGERAALAAAARTGGGVAIVRSSWLFGAHGRCFPRTIIRLASERDRLAIVSDQVGCPTFTGHLAPVLVGLAQDRAPGVWHVAGRESCSWYEFAVQTVAAAGCDCEVSPIATDQYPLPARRPAYSVLGTERGAPRLPGWRDGLQALIGELSGVAA